MNAVLTLSLLLIVLLCTWSGYKRGLILRVLSILAILISIYGANLLSTTYSYEVIDALRPFASGYVETTINDKVREEYDIAGVETASISVDDYLAAHPDQVRPFCMRTFEHIGIHSKTAERLALETEQYADKQETDIRDALVEVLCLRITYVVGFILAFILILIILTVIGNLPNLSFKIPDMDILNDVGGLVLGIVQGLFFCFIVTWALKFTGIIIPQETLGESAILSWFMKQDLLYNFLGI